VKGARLPPPPAEELVAAVNGHQELHDHPHSPHAGPAGRSGDGRSGYTLAGTQARSTTSHHQPPAISHHQPPPATTTRTQARSTTSRPAQLHQEEEPALRAGGARAAGDAPARPAARDAPGHGSRDSRSGSGGRASLRGGGLLRVRSEPASGGFAGSEPGPVPRASDESGGGGPRLERKPSLLASGLSFLKRAFSMRGGRSASRSAVAVLAADAAVHGGTAGAADAAGLAPAGRNASSASSVSRSGLSTGTAAAAAAMGSTSRGAPPGSPQPPSALQWALQSVSTRSLQSVASSSAGGPPRSSNRTFLSRSFRHSAVVGFVNGGGGDAALLSVPEGSADAEPSGAAAVKRLPSLREVLAQGATPGLLTCDAVVELPR
jgi:hypothetical protein